MISTILNRNITLRKNVRIRSYSGPHFPTFTLVRMGENADQNNSEYGHFSRNIKYVSRVKVLHIWFRSKFDFRKLSTLLIGSFLVGIAFLSQMNTFFRKLNHH